MMKLYTVQNEDEKWHFVGSHMLVEHVHNVMNYTCGVWKITKTPVKSLLEKWLRAVKLVLRN